jgi:hypothetical protein
MFTKKDHCDCQHAKSKHRQEFGEPYTGPCRVAGCKCNGRWAVDRSVPDWDNRWKPGAQE